MNIFEIHFNPRAKNEIADKTFDSFCYEPENIYERRMGSLYMAGEIKNLLPQNLYLLKNVSRVIKGKYYATPSQAPEKAFEDCLKAVNEFLAGEVSKENVSWLGNLNFAAISLKSQAQDSFVLNFTKTGVLKILLSSAGKITDIGKNLDFEEIEPYPLKIFTKTVSGKLSFGDKIMILTEEVFDCFSRPPKFSEEKFGRASQNILNEFAKIESFAEKKIREILKPKEKEVSEISGVLLLIDLTKETSEKPKIVTFQKELEKFSMKEVFTPLIKTLRKLGLVLKKTLDKILFKFGGVLHFPKLPARFAQLRKVAGKIELTENLNPLKFFKEKLGRVKRNLILVLLLIFVLGAGFLIFQSEEKQKLKKEEKILKEAQERTLEAENFLIFKDEKKANILFKVAWQEILPLTKEEGPLQNKAKSLKDTIEVNLKNLSKLKEITDPKLIFEFDPKEFIPQKIIYFKGNLYFFSPLSEKLFKINPQTKSQNSYSFPFGKNGEVSLATIFDYSILFFLKPDKIFFFRDDKFAEILSLKPPYSDFNFISFSSYQSNVYFLENKKGEIVKYPSPLEKGKYSPHPWLDPKTKKTTDGKSMAIDGSIWILSENNTISKYYNGQYQTDLILDIFPSPKRLYKILTLPHLPYLYLLEPTQNRIIILEKNGSASSPQAGEIFKQFQSEKFDNLKDFVVSETGKTIYLLNGQKVYQLEL